MLVNVRFHLPDPDGPGPVRTARRYVEPRPNLFRIGSITLIAGPATKGTAPRLQWQVVGVGYEGGAPTVDLR
jgi:hypothetical protein